MKGAILFVGIFLLLIALVFVAWPFVRSIFSGSGMFTGTSTGVSLGNANGSVIESTDGGSSWKTSSAIKNTSLTLDADILHIAFDPFQNDRIFSGTFDRGLYLSEDSGRTWSLVSDSRGILIGNATIYRILFGLEVGRPLYFAAFEKGLGVVLKSENNGKNFEVIYTAPLGEVAVNDIAQDPFDFRVYVATSQGGLLVSENGGETWKVMRWFPGAIVRMSVNPQNGELWVFTKDSRVFRSGDKAASWTELTDAFKELPGSKAKDIRAFVFDPFNRGTLYLGTGLGLLKSVDNGARWSLMKTIVPPEFLPIESVAVSPQNSRNIFITASSQVYHSSDGGVTWEVVQLEIKKKAGIIIFDPANIDRLLITLRK